MLLRLENILILFRILVIRLRTDRRMSQFWTYDLIGELLNTIIVERMNTLKWT